jgi:hypothetical protein
LAQQQVVLFLQQLVQSVPIENNVENCVIWNDTLMFDGPLPILSCGQILKKSLRVEENKNTEQRTSTFYTSRAKPNRREQEGEQNKEEEGIREFTRRRVQLVGSVGLPKQRERCPQCHNRS